VRSALDAVYRACGAVAAVAIAIIAALVTAQVVGRLAGVLVPGADDLAGYALTASSFLGLAYTLRRGGHIRVTLLLQRAGARERAGLEAAALGVGALVTAYFAWHVVEMAIDAWRFGDMSMGVLPIPLWIPQSVMAVGAVVLTVAFVDDLVEVVRGRTPSFDTRADADPAAGPITRDV
jgi:TRAP-type C4-dicarboxylate transport system permease small subunit